MVNLIYQFWIKLESGNVGYQIRNPPASKVGTKNNRFTVISFSTSSSQTSQKWFIREVAIVTISICKFVLPTKQRTIKFLKFCEPVSWLLQTNNFRISKFTIALSSGVDGFSRTSVHVKKRRKKKPRKGLSCKAIRMPNFTSINQAWCWLWAIVTYFFSIYYCSSCEVWHLTQSRVPLKQLLAWISVNSVLESTFMCSKLQMKTSYWMTRW